MTTEISIALYFLSACGYLAFLSYLAVSWFRLTRRAPPPVLHNEELRVALEQMAQANAELVATINRLLVTISDKDVQEILARFRRSEGDQS